MRSSKRLRKQSKKPVMLKAVSCVVGAVLINLTLGSFYSISNIISYVASYMRENGNPDVTTGHGTWFTSAFLVGQGLSVILGSWLEQKWNSRVAVVFGCLVHSTSTYLTIWAVKTNFPTLLLVYGFGSGCGSGSAYIASIIAAQKWFPTRKGFFTGLIVAGFGCGGLIFTNLQTYYMNPDNIRADSAGYFPREVYDKVPNLFLYMAIIFTCTQAIGCILAYPAQETANQSNENFNNSSGPRSPGVTTNVTMDEGLPNIKDSCSPFKYKIFYIISLMMILVAPGVTFVNGLGKRYGQSYIGDDQFLATAVSIGSIANAGGRLIWGYTVDKFSFSACYTTKCILFAILITLFPLGFILSSKPLYMIWLFGLFFGISGSFVLFPVFIEQVFGTRSSGTIYGIIFIAYALASLLTSYLMQISVGARLSDTKTPADDMIYVRLAPCAIIAIMYLASFITYYLTLPVRRIENAIQRRKESEMMQNQRSLVNRSDLFPIDRGTLAEKTAKIAKSPASKKQGRPDDVLTKEDSLGSIVKYVANTIADDGKVKTFGQSNTFRNL